MKALFLVLMFSFHIFPQVSLDSAYKAESSDLLKEIFDNWAQESVPYDYDRIQEPYLYVKYCYQIFEDFYTPKSLSRIGGTEWGEDLYKNIQYAIIQQDLQFRVYDTIPEEIFSDKEPLVSLTIPDFRPKAEVPGAKIIYLDFYKTKMLNEFLDNEFTEFGEGNIMNPAFARDESLKRMEFLNEFIKIFPGHWGGYWQFDTYPEVNIDFNQDLSKAKVRFRIVYQGGEADYERTGNEWKLIKSETTWIE